MSVVVELDVGQFEKTAPLNVNLMGTINEDVRNRFILQKDLKRSQSKNLIEQFLGETFTLGVSEWRTFASEPSRYEVS